MSPHATCAYYEQDAVHYLTLPRREGRLVCMPNLNEARRAADAHAKVFRTIYKDLLEETPCE